MNKFSNITATVAVLNRSNVDTDAIIPKQYLKSIERTGFGQYLFDEWRYLDVGDLSVDVSTRALNPDFELNQAAVRDAEILLTGENFGCGSSREHAVWALADYGFKVIIAPSFADIFYNNCFKNGLLPIVTQHDLFAEKQLTIDLQAQEIITSESVVIPFEIDAFRKHCLLNGLDEIGVTLQHADEIKAYEQKQKTKTPWMFEDVT